MDGMGNLGDLMGMFQQAQQQASRMGEQLDKQLGEIEVQGKAGGGMVTITMTANSRLRDIKIDPEVIDKNEKEMLEDLIVAAFNQALKKAKEAQSQAQQQQLGDMTQGLQGMGPGGLDLSKLFGG